MALNFVAIDVETAAATWDTICAIGLVRVRDGAIVDSYYTLINPECDFAPMNVRIHGITADKVTNAPTLPMIYDTIRDFIGQDILVAHNISFDANSFQRALLKYSLEVPPLETFCTLACSRILDFDTPNHKLKTMCDEYNISLLHHHNASDDAAACANLLISMYHRLEAEDLKDMAAQLHIILGHIDHRSVVTPFSCISGGSRAGNPYCVLSDLKNASPDFANEITMTHLKGGFRIAFKCSDSLLFYYNVSGFPFIKTTDDMNGLMYSDFATQYKDGSWKIPIGGAFLYDRFILDMAETCKEKYYQNPSYTFGCCNDFIRCSDALKCLKVDNPDYRGCSYRKNLEAGRIFYGKNRNI